jgi:3-phenylpropionate/trans-cinnamate dioxygenase ferredoxin subunit
MPRFQLATAGDIPANSMRAFEVGGRRVLVVNLDGSFHALDDLCPHLAIPLSRGELQDGCVVCPGHGSVFDVKTGTAVRWVGLPVTWLARLVKGQASNARIYPIQVENGQLLVEL